MLRINFKKKAIWIGALKDNNELKLEGSNIEFVCNGYFRYLGTDLHVHITKMPDYNYDRIFDRVKRQIISWIKRNITVLFGENNNL